jgi:hypothetical protein
MSDEAEPEWIEVPLHLGSGTSRLLMTPAEARERRDWLNANVRDETFGGAASSE